MMKSVLIHKKIEQSVEHQFFITITPRSTLTQICCIFKVLSIDQIDLLENYEYWMGILETI